MNNKMKQVFNVYMCNKEVVKQKIDDKISSNVYKPRLKILKFLFYGLALTSFILLLQGIYNYNNPVGYVSVDINPSILLSTNKYDKVIELKSLNEDGEKVIKKLDLKNKDVSYAVDMIVNKSVILGYIDEENDDNAILLSVYCNNEKRRNKLQNKLNDEVTNNLTHQGIRSLILDQKLTIDDVKKANEYGVSEGKILFVKKAVNENPELKFEDLIYLPVKEIAKYIDGYNELDMHNKNCSKKKEHCNSNFSKKE